MAQQFWNLYQGQGQWSRDVWLQNERSINYIRHLSPRHQIKGKFERLLLGWAWCWTKTQCPEIGIHLSRYFKDSIYTTECTCYEGAQGECWSHLTKVLAWRKHEFPPSTAGLLQTKELVYLRTTNALLRGDILIYLEVFKRSLFQWGRFQKVRIAEFRRAWNWNLCHALEDTWLALQ